MIKIPNTPFYNVLATAPAREFAASELLDMESHPLSSDGFLWVEDDTATTQVGDRLEAIDHNVYRVTWNTDEPERGEFSLFTSLAHALHSMDNQMPPSSAE